MSVTLSTDELQDDLAVSLARVVATANKRAQAAGINVLQSIISITQVVGEGSRWRVNYGPKEYVRQRGGDLIIEVDADDATVKQVLRGQ